MARSDKTFKEMAQTERLIKGLILVVLVSALAIWGIIYFRNRDINAKVSKVQTTLEDSSVSKWLDYFTNGAYVMCDKMGYDKLQSSAWGEYMLNYSDLTNVYNKLGECISSIVLTNSTEGTYSVTVNYKPYKLNDSVVLDKQYITELGYKYANSKLYTSELQKALNEVYTKSYNDTVYAPTDEEQVGVYTFSEKSGVVYGVKDFIDSMLEVTNILPNLKVYESTIHTEVNKCLMGE